MTRKERIIEILDNELNHLSIQGKTKRSITDEILAIPLDIPDSLEMVNAERAYPITIYSYSNIKDVIAHADKINTAGKGFGDGARWAIKQVTERNQK